jgi:ubiquinone/menaquinone biosynthesis C-methylase UbiE
MSGTISSPTAQWLDAKAQALHLVGELRAALERAVLYGAPPQPEPHFEHTFTLADLAALDDETVASTIRASACSLAPEALALALTGAPVALKHRIARAALPMGEFRPRLDGDCWRPHSGEATARARTALLDAFFWELTYWRTPELYDELTAGEELHPGIFARLGPELRGRTILDVGAGAGRATFACLECGPERVIAVEPSPGLRTILRRKLTWRQDGWRVEVLAGRFGALPVPAASVDVALACSAFTAAPEQGGEPALAEMRRVLRPGGLIIIIWPVPQDFAWLARRGFQYEAVPVLGRPAVHYRSRASAERIVRRFYANLPEALRYVRAGHRSIPYDLLGGNPPHDYCWLRVEQRTQSR